MREKWLYVASEAQKFGYGGEKFVRMGVVGFASVFKERQAKISSYWGSTH